MTLSDLKLLWPLDIYSAVLT